MTQILDRFKYVLKNQKVTQHNLADSIGWDRSKVQRILNGRQPDSIHELLELAQSVIDFDYEWVLKGNGDELQEMKFKVGAGEGVKAHITIDIEGIISLTIKGRMIADAT